MKQGEKSNVTSPERNVTISVPKKFASSLGAHYLPNRAKQHLSMELMYFKIL